MEPRQKRQKFTKEMYIFRNPKIVIEATEYADILMTAGLSVAQGFETPFETSDETLSTCG